LADGLSNEKKRGDRAGLRNALSCKGEKKGKVEKKL